MHGEAPLKGQQEGFLKEGVLGWVLRMETHRRKRRNSGREWPGGGPAGLGMTWALKTPEVSLTEKGRSGP